MAPGHVRSDSTLIGNWLAEKRVLLALWRNNQYRRDVYTLVLANMRPYLDWRIVSTLIAFLVSIPWLLMYMGATQAIGYEVLQITTAVAALMAGATIYTTERQHGTLELVWLATGSEKRLLHLKLISCLVAFIPAVLLACLVTGWYFRFDFPVGQSWFFLMTNALFLLCAMTYIGTHFPQAWAAGLVGIALAGAIYGVFRNLPTNFTPFLNPIALQAEPKGASLPVNRFFMIAFSIVFFQFAAKRLRRAG